MKVHLFRTVDFLRSDFDSVMQFFESRNDTYIKYIFYLEDELQPYNNTELYYEFNYFESVKNLPQSTLYYEKESIKLRKLYDIKELDFVFIFSSQPGDCNWWLSSSRTNERSIFVHPNYVDPIFGYNLSFISSFYVITQPFLLLQYLTREEIIRNAHRVNIKGCILDYSTNQQELILKLKTCNFCSDCWFKARKSNLDVQIINITRRLLRELSNLLLEASYNATALMNAPLVCSNNSYQLSIPELQIENIYLRPIEKALYVLHLKNSQGIAREDLYDYKQELLQIYGRVHNHSSREAASNVIDELVDITSNSYNERLSRIRRCFRQTLGPELAEHYVIKGQRAQRRVIPISDANMVIWID